MKSSKTQSSLLDSNTFLLTNHSRSEIFLFPEEHRETNNGAIDEKTAKN